MTMAWELAGNAGTDPATNFLGTTDGKPLSIQPETGNVGIGTTGPTAKLEVNQGSSSHEVAHFVQGVPAQFNVDVWWKGGPGPDWLLSKRTAAGGIGDFWFYNPTDGVVMTLNPGGNVGIGTTAPAAKLVVDQVSNSN